MFIRTLSNNNEGNYKDIRKDKDMQEDWAEPSGHIKEIGQR
jgi:hypothetical protein